MQSPRLDGVTAADFASSLRREDELNVLALRQLAASIMRLTDSEGGSVLRAEEEVGGGDLPAAGLLSIEVARSRSLGGVWFLDALWRRLGIQEAFDGELERVLFAMVAHRALAPASKLAWAEWALEEVAIPGLSDLDDERCARAIDLLVEADADADVQRAAFLTAAELLNLGIDLAFLDTTSTYFERDQKTDQGDHGTRVDSDTGNDQGARPPVVIGLAVTREGIPARVWVWPGYADDLRVIGQAREDLGAWHIERVVRLVDRGGPGGESVSSLTGLGGHWIAGDSTRDGSADALAALSHPGRYQKVRDDLAAKELRIGADSAAKRAFVCHDPPVAARDKRLRDLEIAHLKEELARIEAARESDERAESDGADRRAESALHDHPTLGRYLRRATNGRVLIDRSKVAAAKRSDGKHLLTTSDAELSARDVALGYKNLLEAERSFRELNGALDLRTVRDNLERRIRAHVVLCWLALLLIRVAERQADEPWERIAVELERLHVVTLAGPAGTVSRTTTLTDRQRQIFASLSIDPPPASPE